MGHEKLEELRQNLLFFKPWLRWHMDNCIQSGAYVKWHRDQADERFLYAILQLDESLSKDAFDGKILLLEFNHFRKVREIKGAITEPSNDLKSQLNWSMDDVVIKFMDSELKYLMFESINVNITNICLYECLKKQLRNIEDSDLKNMNPFLCNLFIYNKYKMSCDELKLENKLKDPSQTIQFHENCNESQRNVINEAISNRVTLVNGPPGTGKTFTSAVLVFNLHITRQARSKILVCAKSNVAVDNLANKILELYEQLNVLRIRSFRSETIKTTKLSDFLYLDRRLMTEKGKIFDEYRLILKEEQARFDYLIHIEKSARLRSLEAQCERMIIDKADVLCTTCSGSSRLYRLLGEGIEIDSLVIDECTQVDQPEALLPIRLCPRRIVVVGDDKQLGVVITDDVAKDLPQHTEDRLSLFRMLKRKGFKPMLLDVQYRMHPVLVEFSNEMFYGNRIKNGIEPEDRKWSDLNHRSPFPEWNKPIYFHCHNYPETAGEQKSKSRYNDGEVDIVVETIKVLLSRGVVGHRIGVITPYRLQCQKIKEKLPQMRNDLVNIDKNRAKNNEKFIAHSNFKSSKDSAITVKNSRRSKGKRSKFAADFDHIEVATVDAYQGREKDYIILSMVRSVEEGSIKFVADKRRLNVSLTRARFGMIVVGNPAVLKREPLLNEFMKRLSRKDSLYNKVLSENSKPIKLDTFNRLNNRIAVPNKILQTVR